MKRLLQHLTMTRGRLRRAFPQTALHKIASAVREAEQSHGGEIRVAIEAELPLRDLLAKQSPRQRALQVFADLQVWNTADRNGVLIYLCLADRDIEIVADAGFDTRVTEGEWTQVCRDMEVRAQAGQFEAAIVHAVQAVSVLIARHYPAADRNELSDYPTLL